MIRDTADIMNSIAQSEKNGVPIEFLELGAGKRQIYSSYGDLVAIINAMADYADLLDGYRVTYPERLNAFQAATYEYQAERCRKIQKSFEAQIGYDRAANIEKCQKRREKNKAEDDVGEEALVLMARRAQSEAKKKKEEQEQKGKPATEARKKSHNLTGQMSLFG